MGTYDTSIGTLLIGVFFNTFLYGLVTYQFALYYQTKFNDPPVVKCMVGFFFILDTFHSSIAIYLAWFYTVTNYDNPAGLASGQWLYGITPFCTALTALITQLYLGFRIRRFTDSKLLFGVVIVLSIASFVLGFTSTVGPWIVTISNGTNLPSLVSLLIAWLVTQVAVDLFITTVLVISFHRSRTGFRRTDTVLDRLIRGAVQTGLFAGIFALGNLISFTAAPTWGLFETFAIPTGRIYTNTLLDTLLSRDVLKQELCATYDLSGGLGSMNWAAGSSQGTSGQSANNGCSVGIIPADEDHGVQNKASSLVV